MFYTRRGDDGYTDMLGGPRVAKDSVRPEALGTIDEASAALGLARATAQRDETKQAVIQVQRDLYLLMADIATLAGKHAGNPRLTAEHLNAMEATIKQLDPLVTIPKEFVASGDSVAGAALDMARTIVRRAERVVARLQREEDVALPHSLAYLNRLSSLLFGLARFEDVAAGATSTIAKLIKS